MRHRANSRLGIAVFVIGLVTTMLIFSTVGQTQAKTILASIEEDSEKQTENSQTPNEDSEVLTEDSEELIKDSDREENIEEKPLVINRISGKNRLETSKLIAEELATEPVANIVLVSGEKFPDALSAAPLAAKLNTSILLSNQNVESSKEVIEYITNNLQTEGTIYIIGGEKVIGEVKALEDKGYQIKRIAGDSRYKTNLEVVKELELAEGTPLFIASGESFADALSVSSVAASLKYPIVLVSKDDIPLNTQEYIEELNPEKIYLIGGVEVISEEVLVKLEELAPNSEIKRFAGKDRFDTGMEVIKEFIDEPSKVYFASGYDFADALSGSMLAAKTSSPIILVDTNLIEPPLKVDLYLNELFVNDKIPDITVFGGSRVITNTLVDTLGETVYLGYESEQLKSYREMEKSGEVDYAKIAKPKRNQKEYFTISAVGDCTLGTDARFGYGGSLPQTYDQNGPEYFFSGVKEILGQDDLTIANLETPLTQAKEQIDKGTPVNNFWFKGDPSYVEILKSGSVEAVHIANNHSFDFKEKGYQDTQEVLKKEGISYYGYEHTAIFEKKGVKVGLFGYNLVGFSPTAANKEKLKKEIASRITELKKEAQVVIVSFHWGIENNFQMTPLQRELGQYSIDQGADLVLGHHPHVLEPIEKYKGKYIVYSLGNFVFGGNHNPWDKDTIIFQQAIELVNGEFWGLADAKVIPARLSSVNFKNDYKPVVATDKADINRILRKVNWK